jgi:hypothetical protein
LAITASNARWRDSLPPLVLGAALVVEKAGFGWQRFEG